jgi:hypothetical protein
VCLGPHLADPNSGWAGRPGSMPAGWCTHFGGRDSGELIGASPPHRRSGGGGARQHPVREAEEKGGRSVEEVAGVCAVLVRCRLGRGMVLAARRR